MDKNIYSEFEFLTGLSYAGQEYVGIIVNYDNQLVSFYDVESIVSIERKKQFIALGETWWWESNRQLPIDVFLHLEMREFGDALKTFAAKDVEVLFGPVTTLQNLIKKRIKRRTVQLVRKNN